MMKSGKAQKLTIGEIKSLLSEGEFQEAKTKITNAEKTLEEVKQLLSSSMFLRDGKLTSGTIDYAAFRIQTLSLIFELAAQNFNKAGGAGEQAYTNFLKELGDEVGFTFGRDIINRLSEKDLMIQVSDLEQIIELWVSYENETGAGITKLKKCDDNKIVVQLENNPLRRVESTPHKHCGFYINYIHSFLNEIITSKSRILEAMIEGSKIKSRIVHRVDEHPDANDVCVFTSVRRDEKLTKAISELHKAYNLFFRINATDDYSTCAPLARSALMSAQMEFLSLTSERMPPQLFKVFSEVFPNKDSFKRMDEAYQVASKYCHLEAGSTKPLTKDRCWELLADVRKTIYELEFIDIEDGKKKELYKLGLAISKLKSLEDALADEKKLCDADKTEINKIVSQLKKGKLVDESVSSNAAKILSNLGGKVWEVAKPVLSEILSESIKSQYGL